MFLLSWVVVGYKWNVDIEALMNSIINGEESTILHSRLYSQHSHRDRKQKQRERTKQWLARATDTLSVDLSKGEGGGY